MSCSQHLECQLIGRRRDGSRSVASFTKSQTRLVLQEWISQFTYHVTHTRKYTNVHGFSSGRSEALLRWLGFSTNRPPARLKVPVAGGQADLRASGLWAAGATLRRGFGATRQEVCLATCLRTHALTKEKEKKAIFSFPNLFLCTIQWVKYDKMKRWYLVFQNISALHGAV